MQTQAPELLPFALYYVVFARKDTELSRRSGICVLKAWGEATWGE